MKIELTEKQFNLILQQDNPSDLLVVYFMVEEICESCAATGEGDLLPTIVIAKKLKISERRVVDAVLKLKELNIY